MRPKRLLSACLALALCLGLLPVTALAVDTAPQTLYVGSTTIGTGYWTSSDGGKVWTSQADKPEGHNYIYYDGQGTLELHNATIQGGSNTGSAPFGSGIYALSSSGQPVALTIELIGTNTITGTFGIFLNAEIDASSYGTNATLTITSENNGSLEVSGSNHGIFVNSGTGNASLNIEKATVTSSTNGNYAAGVCVQSGASATEPPNISLAVDGGSLTASASEGNDGIQFYVGSSEATDATTRLTVSENAIVDARNGGISASRILETLPTPTPTGNNSSGIVFDDKNGTVYGNVTLDESLTINQGETLTVPDGSKLDCKNNLTNNGTILASGGTVTGSLSGGTPLTTPSISQQPQSTTVTEGSTAEFSITASDAQTYQWQRKATYTESEWENISDATTTSYTTADTTTDMSGYQYRCVVKSASGVSVISQTATLTVQAKPASVPVTGVTLDKTTLELFTGGSATLTATVQPDDATNKNVTWQSDNANVATVQNGTVNAVGAGEATITVTTEDSGFTANCTVTVREDVPDRPVSIPDTHEIELIAGDGGEAKTSLTNASAGTKITVTATPDAGYELAYITVDGERISGVSFTMPAHDVTVRVYFSGGALPFADVTEGAWYYDAVSYVYVNGLMDGLSASEFAPEANMTRAMFWTILARIDGEAITGEGWAEDAREWAMESGVSDGTDPNGLVTREQFATMLYRYAGEPAASGSLSAYTDAESVSEWATDAMLWATQNGIITGTTAATLAPQGAATRAQCAAMLMRFAER